MDKAKRGIINELHKQARKNFPRRRVYVKGIDDLWQIDLVDLQKYAKFNAGHKYILTVIDVLSKYAWAVPVKSKRGDAVTAAMNHVFTTSRPRVPRNIQSDAGKEFYNSPFKALMQRLNINLYSSYSHLKASVVERFNRTLKGWMYKEFGYQGTYKWTHILADLLKRYNNRVHRTISMRPSDVTKRDEKRLLHVVNPSSSSPLAAVKPRFKSGDIVRVSKYKTQFEKGYTPSWSTELFTIDEVRTTVPPVYTLRDLQGQIIKGTFYGYELQRTMYPDTYLVEKVLRRKGQRAYVKWLGMSSAHNSWI